jgi:hypothetical protein
MRKHKKLNSSSSDEEENSRIKGKAHLETQEAAIRGCGRKYAAMHQLWLPSLSIIKTTLKAEYDPTKRYENPKSQKQGMLRELLSVMEDCGLRVSEDQRTSSLWFPHWVSA